jgi:hypothetical protein
MTPKGERIISMKMLIVDDELHLPTANGRAARSLVEELHSRDVQMTARPLSSPIHQYNAFCWIGAWETTIPRLMLKPSLCCLKFVCEMCIYQYF